MTVDELISDLLTQKANLGNQSSRAAVNLETASELIKFYMDQHGDPECSYCGRTLEHIDTEIAHRACTECRNLHL